MDYGKIFRQAWNNMLHYRALWIFGVILALTTASTSVNSFYGNDSSSSDNGRGPSHSTICDWSPESRESFRHAMDDCFGEIREEMGFGFEEADRELSQALREELGLDIRVNLRRTIVTLVIFIVLMTVIGTVLKYVSWAAIIKMVDEQEETGEKRRARYGWRFGFSRRALRLFLLDLLVDIPATVVFMVLFALIFTPLFLLELGIMVAGLLGVVLTSGLFFLFILLAIVTSAVLRLLKHFMRRALILEELGLVDSIKRGYQLVRSHLKEAGLIWLVMVGINIGWPFALGILAIFFVALAVLIAGPFGLIAGGIGFLAGATQPVLTGLIVGIPIFVIALSLPLLFLEGLKKVFESSTWTLAFREFRTPATLAADVGAVLAMDADDSDVEPVDAGAETEVDDADDTDTDNTDADPTE